MTRLKGTRLTNKEKEVLYLLVIGLSTNEISEHLFISEDTVRNHRKSLLKKLAQRIAKTCCGVRLNIKLSVRYKIAIFKKGYFFLQDLKIVLSHALKIRTSPFFN